MSQVTKILQVSQVSHHKTDVKMFVILIELEELKLKLKTEPKNQKQNQKEPFITDWQFW